ncbi:MAG: hypothetical protein PVG65_05610 [Candidatus Thorarchaeota archaeon]|jgi:thymidylate kinase
MIISISGVDGSGKTTLSLYLMNIFAKNGRRVEYIHMTKWTMVNKLGRILKNTFGIERQELTSKKKKGVSIIKSIIKFMYIVDILLFYFYSIYMCKVRGIVLVCDRYFYDLGIQAIYIGMFNESFESIYWHLVPKPDISFLLDINPLVAKVREGDHDISYYENKRKLYIKRAKYWECEIIRGENKENVEKVVMNYLSL